jgi:hypothetical protein
LNFAGSIFPALAVVNAVMNHRVLAPKGYFVSIFHLPHACYTPRSSHSP